MLMKSIASRSRKPVGVSLSSIDPSSIRGVLLSEKSLIGSVGGYENYLWVRWKGSETTCKFDRIAHTNKHPQQEEQPKTRSRWNSYTSPSLSTGRQPVTKHTVTKQRQIPANSPIVQPPYAKTGRIPFNFFSEMTIIHLQDEYTIERLKTSGALAASILEMTCATAQSSPGITTDEIDQMVHHAILEAGAYPSPLNYRGFPKSLCSSVNEVVCHGIPDTRPLMFGDVVSFDVSVFIDGVHGDNCATVIVGDEKKLGDVCANKDDGSEKDELHEERRLVKATQEALQAAIAACKPGGCLSHIGHAVSSVADAYGYSSVRDYRGHGINETFHCPPYVKHYRNDDELELIPGMVFTIEPMLVQKSPGVQEWDDGWTVVARDGGLAAQFEHMVWFTEDGVQILTDNPVYNPSGL